MDRSPLYSFKSQRGATLITVLVMLVVLGVTIGITGASWKTITQRVREAELLWRGKQYMRAIESYYATRQPNQPKIDLENSAQVKGYTGMLPREAEHLLKDNRFAQTVRHLRNLYKDPMTGEDFVFLKDPGGRIKGVRSSSTDKPFKQDGFTEEFEEFNGAEKYSDWLFVFDVPGGSVQGGLNLGDGGRDLPPLPTKDQDQDQEPDQDKDKGPDKGQEQDPNRPIPGNRATPPPGYSENDGFYRGSQWFWYKPQWKRIENRE